MSSSETKDQEEDDKKKLFPFHEMGLDDRILKAIAKLGWINPTLIQERAIPLILEGKDLLARGRTGSGKTGAFCIPLIQRILEVKTNGSENVNQVRQNWLVLLYTPLKSVLIKYLGCERMCVVSQQRTGQADL